MTSSITIEPSELEGLTDPENPTDDRGFIGVFTITAHVDLRTGKVTPSYGADVDARILQTCKNFFREYGYSFCAWYMEAEGVSIVREDGLPYRQHEILKLQSKDGRNLGKNQLHAKVAAEFNRLGVSASYLRVAEPNTALGRTFRFKTADIDLGRGYKKEGFRLWPEEVFPEGYVYDGEVHTVSVRRDEEADGSYAVARAEVDVDAVGILRKILAGQPPSAMLDIILAEPALRNVASVFGVPLVESATDESLATVLQEHKVMALDAQGRLVPL